MTKTTRYPGYMPSERYGSHYAPVLGPCRCQNCGESLWWAKRQTRNLGMVVTRFGWREEDGVLHRCPNVAIAA